MASFTDLDTLHQMGFVSTYFDSQSRLHLKFSCAGTGITFNGTIDSVNVIAANKQQMTVDNINIYSAPIIMPGVMEKYEPIILPSVSISGDFNDQNNKFSFENSHVDTTLLPNVARVMYEWGTQQYKEYDTTKSYAVWSYSLLNGSLVGRTGFSVEPLTGGGKTIIQCLNSTSKSITVSYCFIAVCSSSSATVITVYDSSNNPYNAFKYTSDGTDYYYVLDGTQTDWTDDLASIGYSLQQIYTAYFSDQGISGSNVTYSGTSRLYDVSGNLLYYDPAKSYTLITGYLKNGTENNPDDCGVQCYFTQQDSSLHTLGLFANEAFTFYKILYLVTPTA